MSEPKQTADKLLTALQERAKELNCLYEIEELVNRADLTLGEVLEAAVRVLPPGWQYPGECEAEIAFGGRTYRSAEFSHTKWRLDADLVVQREKVGRISVFYTAWQPAEDEGPFLKEEVRLIRTIAERLSHFVFYQQLKAMRQDLDQVSLDVEGRVAGEWRAPVHLLRRTDRDLYLRIARKLVNHLFWTGCDEAGDWLGAGLVEEDAQLEGEVNAPGPLRDADESWLMSDGPFELASRCLGDGEILRRIQQWMVQDRASSFTKVLYNGRHSLPEVADALRRYHCAIADGSELPRHLVMGLRVALIRRLLTEQLDFIQVAKEFIGTRTFEALLERVVMPGDGHGRIGGKAAGLVLAHRLLRKTSDLPEAYRIKAPLSWFIASTGLRHFIAYNDLEDVHEQKYRDLDEVRHEYPNIIQLFKRSRFPPEIVKGLAVALDEFEDRPLIVRSSSLLEDRVGTAFSGKYKSLFLANQGSKRQRLQALLDAIAEVYASTFGPDPIEYRRDHGLLDFNEEMGILLQEVVGRRVGRYFMPAFAGVAFSVNEFRWSPRIRREDGLLRLVPGLGSRAVDRVAEDYPVLVVPGQPNLRANTSVDEVVRYSPKKVDVIDLERGRFRTVELRELLETCGTDLPGFEAVLSKLEHGVFRKPVALLADPRRDDLVVTFDGVVHESSFVDQMDRILQILQQTLGKPVDLEFAHDGEQLYLLQCRTQSSGLDSGAAPIPREVDKHDVLFTARRFVSNGWVPDLTHVVYVDADAYAALPGREDLLTVGRAVGRLNKMLPRRRFALIGPGRWGSRGDIKLGVSVTYADINNTAMLIEVARQKGRYVPDLSFGTHFFQDLVESEIRYLPLYPDDEGVVFKERFFQRSHNLLAEMCPEFAGLEDVVKVIDIPANREGRVLRVLMNADLDEAMALLVDPDESGDQAPAPVRRTRFHRAPDEFWRWRLQMAEQIAASMDPERFGVVGFYVFGSTKNATAGPGSDIDLLIHVRQNPQQRQELDLWLEGWSLSLAQMNYLRTGYRTPDLLDVHYVTDEDIAARTSWAVKIGAITDAARPLPMGGSPRG